DTTRPTMAQPDDVTVVTTSTDATIAVHFEYPVAQDDRSGAIVSTCTPASGSQFTVGATKRVTCRASDAAGNSVSRSFDVIVKRGVPTFMYAGVTMAGSTGGHLPN